ncbi:hypothetical protein DFV88_24820 [Salmonella enterica subsp. enterica serovar Newport]|nr:hypothetical protein [Salmonella enterica subsp. enterica serovar Newport]
MGSLFKKKSSTTKSTEKTQNQNWLAQNKEYSALVNQGISQGSQMNIPGYEVAGFGPEYQAAAQRLLTGADYGYLTNAADYFGGIGKGQLTSGLALQQQAQTGISRLANLSQEDFDKGIAAEFNSQLVNEQIAGLKSDINEQYLGAVSGLNLNAATTGNMGSSRAGVAQAVMSGQAMKAISSGSLAYRTAEESAATQRYQSLLGFQQQGVSQLANLANQQIGYGSQFANQAVGYQNQYTAGWLQNQQNAMNVGATQQAYQQQLLDINRQNQLLAQSPALARLGYMNQFLGPIANYSTSGTRTTTTVAPPQGNGLMGGIMGAAGAVAGAYFGGPMGAQLGASLGGAVGNSI